MQTILRVGLASTYDEKTGEYGAVGHVVAKTEFLANATQEIEDPGTGEVKQHTAQVIIMKLGVAWESETMRQPAISFYDASELVFLGIPELENEAEEQVAAIEDILESDMNTAVQIGAIEDILGIGDDEDGQEEAAS